VAASLHRTPQRMLLAQGDDCSPAGSGLRRAAAPMGEAWWEAFWHYASHPLLRQPQAGQLLKLLSALTASKHAVSTLAKQRASPARHIARLPPASATTHMHWFTRIFLPLMYSALSSL
jgi:hypothetical protein